MTHDEGIHEIYGGYVLDRNASMQRILAQDPKLRDILNDVFIEQKVRSHNGGYEESFDPDDGLDADGLPSPLGRIMQESGQEREKRQEEKRRQEAALAKYRPYMETVMTLQDIADGMLHFNRREAEGKDITHYYKHGDQTVAGSAMYIDFTPPEPLTYERIKAVLSYADNVENRKAGGEVIDEEMVKFISEHRQEFRKLQNTLDRNTRIGGLKYSRDDESEFGWRSIEYVENVEADNREHLRVEPVADSRLLSNAGTPASWYDRDVKRASSR